MSVRRGRSTVRLEDHHVGAITPTIGHQHVPRRGEHLAERERFSKIGVNYRDTTDETEQCFGDRRVEIASGHPTHLYAEIGGPGLDAVVLADDMNSMAG